MPRLKLVVAYTGTHFAGWQLQPQKRTVQGCLEEALGKLCQCPVRIHGAGRTDSGVHALGQVCHCEIPETKTHIPWQKALNALLPKDMTICDATHVDPTFHARFNAQSKEYAYTLWTEAQYVLPQRRPFVWPVGPLDTSKMLRAAEMLTGTHDFAAFQNTGTPVSHTVRTLWRLIPEPCARAEEITWIVCADGFLKQMVRNILGCLVAVGRHALPEQAVQELLHEGDRSRAPATAPAKGLCLRRVTYTSDSAPITT